MSFNPGSALTPSHDDPLEDSVPDDYDVQIRALRRARGVNQVQLATVIVRLRKISAVASGYAAALRSRKPGSVMSSNSRTGGTPGS